MIAISLANILLVLLALAVVASLALLLILYVTTSNRLAVITRYRSEQRASPDNIGLPWLEQDASLDLSVIVPSYNEEERLPVMLDETLEYLEQRQARGNFRYEVIVVDDGSRDRTSEVATAYAQKYGSEKIRVLTLQKNRGKGGAVQLGVLSSRGEKILFVDADGATKFSDLDSVEEGLVELQGGRAGMAIAVGSRAHLQDAATAERSFFRTILMHGFHLLVYATCVRGVRDTQCGFKLFTRAAAIELFKSLHVQRWAFDVELLFLAQQLGVPVSERAVNWQEIDGSKMVPLFSWLQMGRDLVFIRMRYALSLWAINSGQPIVVELD